MSSITGTYYNGELKLDRPLITKSPIRVTLTFEEDNSSELKLSDFSFLETQELLKDCNSSFSNDLIEERRKDL